MRFCRPASRALSHLLRHEPVYHTSPASLLSRHSPFTPLTRAFNDPFFSSPFSAPLYTVYEVREDDNNNTTDSSSKAEPQQAKQEEVKAAEQQQQQQQQQRSSDNRLARHGDSHRQRWLDRHHNRRHRHHHHPLALFSPLDSLFTSPFFAASSHQPLEISVDLYSTPSAYQVHAAIPGVRKEDIKLTVDDGVLTIEAERREERSRPARAAGTPASSTATSASTTTTAPADATTEAPHSEPKTVEVEVKAESGSDSKPVAETKAQETQPQQQPHASEEDDDVAVHHVESYYGRAQRSLALPDDVDVEGLTARYEDGVLRIELPRIEEKKQQPKKINIQ